MSGLLGAGIGGIAGALGNAAGGAASAVKGATRHWRRNSAELARRPKAQPMYPAQPVTPVIQPAAQTGVNGVQVVGQTANAVTGSRPSSEHAPDGQTSRSQALSHLADARESLVKPGLMTRLKRSEKNAEALR